MPDNLSIKFKKQQKAAIWPLFVLTALFLTLTVGPVCKKKQALAPYTLRGGAMGTSFEIRILLPDSLSVETVKEGVAGVIEGIEQIASTYRVKSEISMINKNRSLEPVNISPDLAKMIRIALTLSEKSSGAYDITILPLVNLWGFGPQGNSKRPPAAEQIEQALQNVGMQNIELILPPGEGVTLAQLRKKKEGVSIDLSSLAKGYAVDLVGQYLRETGIRNYFVEIGGELIAFGKANEDRMWLAGVETPPESRLGNMEIPVSGYALATSGVDRNYFTDEEKVYSHIINPEDGYPVSEGPVLASVLHPECAKADALATLLLGMPGGKAKRFSEENHLAVLLLYYHREDQQWEKFTTKEWDLFLAERAPIDDTIK